jgi:putative ABC transport system permease protein
MGFDKRDIYGMITRENSFMVILAILAGMPMGASMISGMAKTFSSDMITFPAMYSPWIFLQAAAASVDFVVIAQLATLKKVYNLNFIDALKSRIS